jgi:hypothetical protein
MGTRRAVEEAMKLNMRTAAAVVGALTVVAAMAAADDQAAPGPVFRVEQETIDLGEITAGSEAVAVFRFHNAGDADVHIIRAKPS